MDNKLKNPEAASPDMVSRDEIAADVMERLMRIAAVIYGNGSIPTFQVRLSHQGWVAESLDLADRRMNGTRFCSDAQPSLAMALHGLRRDLEAGVRREASLAADRLKSLADPAGVAMVAPAATTC